METCNQLGFQTEDILEVRASFDSFWLSSAWAGGGSKDDSERKRQQEATATRSNTNDRNCSSVISQGKILGLP